jgi:hypothetical protein
MTCTNGDKALYERFYVSRCFAPYVGRFLFDMYDGIVGTYCAVDEVAAFNRCGGEVRGRSGSCEGGFKNGRTVVASC